MLATSVIMLLNNTLVHLLCDYSDKGIPRLAVDILSVKSVKGVSVGLKNKLRVASSRVKQTTTVSQFPFYSKSACRMSEFY